MDWQAAFNALFGLFIVVISWVGTMLHDRVSKAEEKQDAFRNEVPKTYARRDDVKDRFDEVVSFLRRIEDKVDRHT